MWLKKPAMRINNSIRMNELISEKPENGSHLWKYTSTAAADKFRHINDKKLGRGK